MTAPRHPELYHRDGATLLRLSQTLPPKQSLAVHGNGQYGRQKYHGYPPPTPLWCAFLRTSTPPSPTDNGTVYDLPAEVLTTLSLKPDAAIPDQSPPSPPSKDTPGSDLVGSQACSLCGLTFSTVLDQRSHQKSDWHHYNLKQKLRGAKPVTEQEFEKLIGGNAPLHLPCACELCD